MTPTDDDPPADAGFDTGDEVVDSALAELADADPDAARCAETGFAGLTWGTGLHTVSLRGLQEYLWYQLPEKYWGPVEEHHAIASGLGSLFDRLGLPRYAAVCTDPVTASILNTYATGGRSAGITAYRKALVTSGVEPPDIPGLLSWGGTLGVEEHAAFWALGDHLETAITTGTYSPGTRGWKDTRDATAAAFLTVPQLALGGDSYLDRIHTERRTRWAQSRGPGRRELTEAVLPLLTGDPTIPADAENRLAQVRWFLQQCAGDGAALTVNHTLSRALLTEACHRFDWLTLGKQAPPENQLPEAFRLRAVVNQLGATRRRGRRLLLTTRGRHLLNADTDTLWTETAATLIPHQPAEAAAAEIMLMLLLTGQPPAYRSPVVADILSGEGWRNQDDGQPLTPDGTGWLTGELFGRMESLQLTDGHHLTHRSPLNTAGRAAAITALRCRAHAPRNHP
jgi:hypothetical protein